MFIHSSHSTTKAESKLLLNLPIPPVNNDTITAAKFRLLRFFVKQSIRWSNLGGVENRLCLDTIGVKGVVSRVIKSSLQKIS